MATQTAVALCLLFSTGAQAQVYKCVEGGKTVYSDSPCNQEQIERIRAEAARKAAAAAEAKAKREAEAATWEAELQARAKANEEEARKAKANPRPVFRSSVITMTAYSRIETYMTYEEAVAVLGQRGVEMSRSYIAGYDTVMYQWVNRDGSNMNAMFQNDRLIQKAQFGLR
ncbi:MAG: DUF4124 domain-containing protein [Proteobacteria bacterium]|nr:DUF4124 domain-containing protein [Pseudomonadota bacterium]